MPSSSASLSGFAGVRRAHAFPGEGIAQGAGLIVAAGELIVVFEDGHGYLPLSSVAAVYNRRRNGREKCDIVGSYAEGQFSP